MPFTYQYPRPAVTADTVVLALGEEGLEVLLIERGHDPFAGFWALPGGFAEMDETLEASARRELDEETGLKPQRLVPFGTFGDPGRDPRGRVVTIAFLAMIRRDEHRVVAASDAARAGWFDLGHLPPLAFDHDRILAVAREYLQLLSRVRPFGLDLLPETFTIDQLRRLYELVLAREVSRDTILRKVVDAGLLVAVGESNAAERRHSFDRDRYEELERDGLDPAL